MEQRKVNRKQCLNHAHIGFPRFRPQLMWWIIAISMGILVLAGCDLGTLPPSLMPSSSQPVPATPEKPTLLPTPVPSQPAIATPVNSPLPSAPIPTSIAGPRILSFVVVPTTTLAVGERISLTWEALGEKAEICGVWGPGPVDCQNVPLQGSMSIEVDEQMLGYYGLLLRASEGQSETLTVVNVRFRCQGLRDWFFDDPPMRCPAEAAAYSRATAQTFEHGFMVWVEQPDRLYVFFTDSYEFIWLEAPYTTKPGTPVVETPPPGYFVPVGVFGQLWRDEIEGVSSHRVHERLAWATEAEIAFDTAYQCEVEGYPRMWSCYLRGPDGQVLRLYPDSTAQVRFLWQEW